VRVLRLHHVGVLVADADAVTCALEVLGMPAERHEHYASELAIGFHSCGNALIEVITPRSGEGWNAQWLARTGPSIQHLAFEVADIGEALSELTARGVPLLQPAPRPGAGGTTIAFIDPAASGSILLELVYDPAGTTASGSPGPAVPGADGRTSDPL
jgi:methylmalonyl-CoA/ethylmalonyl-CoA epimerase